MKKYALIIVLALCTSLQVMAQSELTITGHVTDTKGEDIIGASVIVKDAKGLGTITDVMGQYSIKVQEYRTLVFSYIGYIPQEVLVKGDKTTIDIVLKEDEQNAIDEVVVTGMGTQKKLTVTGAVSNVKMDDLKHYSTSNLTNTLAGNVPGIMAFQRSGQPGKNTSEFWIRGISTFGASSKAYILVDGFERDNIDDLNIEDIENFSVLKDASATAIYGSNEFVNGFQYANYLNEARVTRNLGVLYQPVELEIIREGLDPDLYPNVDWRDLLLKDGAMSYRANVNLSGGGETARYYVSMAYTEDEGMYKTDKTLRDKYDTNANYKRWNYRMNVDIDVTKTTILKLGIGGNLNKRNSPGIGDDKVWGQLFGYNPLFTPVVYSNGFFPAKGEYNTEERDGISYYTLNENYINPWVSSTQTGYNNEWQNEIQTNVTLEQDLGFITKGLTFTGRFGFDTHNENAIQHHRLPALYSARSRNTETGLLDFQMVQSAQDMTQSTANSGWRREFLDLLLHWDRSFAAAHNFGANVKFTENQHITTQNLGNDIKNSVSRKNKGLAAQFTYNYKYRYFLDYNFGYNGSENFADGHRWGFFPAWSVAWNVGEEPWVKAKAPWIDMFKIRFSHGKVGSDATGNSRFPYLYTIVSGETQAGEDVLGDHNTNYNWGQDHTNTYNTAMYRQVASESVTWEVATKNDIGIDLVLFNNKFSLTVDYFDEKRTGIYQERRFLPTTVGLEYWDSNGWNYPKANVGSVTSRGIDGNFRYEQRLGDVNITVRGNMTYSKNKIGDYDEENNVYPYQNQHGYRINQVRGLIALGLFKDYDDIRNSPTQTFGSVQPGDIKYKDVNGDGIIDGGDECAIGATSRPNLIYGLGFSVAWKGFDFNLHFQGAGKCTSLIYGKNVYAFSEGQWGNIFKGLLEDRWVDRETAQLLGIQANENVNASYPRLSYNGNNNNHRASTFWLRDGHYLRLKNLDIGYTLPKKFVNKAHLQNVRFFVQATNLLFLSKSFSTWDPESLPDQPRGEDYPITKAITLGMQLNL